MLYHCLQAVIHEAENKPDSFVVNCVCKHKRKDPVMAKLFAVQSATDGVVLQIWDITAADPNAFLMLLLNLGRS